MLNLLGEFSKKMLKKDFYPFFRVYLLVWASDIRETMKRENVEKKEWRMKVPFSSINFG